MEENLEFDTDNADFVDPVTDADDAAADLAPPPVDDAPHDQAWDVPEVPPLPEGGFDDEVGTPPPPPPHSGAGEPTGQPFDLAPAGDPPADDPPGHGLDAPAPPIDPGRIDLAPPGDPGGDQGDQPPLPPGIDGGTEDQSPFPLMGGDGDETVDDDAPPAPPIDLGGVDLAAPGDGGTGEQGDQPPLPPGIDDEGQSPFPTMGGDGIGDDELIGDPWDDLGPTPPIDLSGVVLAPPADPGTGEPGDQPPLPPGIDGAANGQSPVPTMGGAGNDTEEPGDTSENVTGAEDLVSWPEPEPPTAGVVPASLAALLADDLVPPEHLRAFLTDVEGLTDGAGNVSMTGLVDSLAAHSVDVTSAGDRSLEEVCRNARRVDILGEVAPGRVERLRIEAFDDGDRSVTLRSRGGDGFRMPAAEVSSLWSAQGSPVVAVPSPTEEVAAVPVAAVAEDTGGGMSGAGKVALGGALLLPVLAGGGALAARKLRR